MSTVNYPDSCILIPPKVTAPVEPSLDGPNAARFHILERDYRFSPPETPESVRTVYEAIAFAMIESERLHSLLPKLAGEKLHRLATTTRDLITQAMTAYRQAELHLRNPISVGFCSFKEANQTLDNVRGMICSAENRGIQMLPLMNWDVLGLNAMKTLISMRDRLGAITEVKVAPPQRVGENYIIQGFTLELSEQTADILELGLVKDGTPSDAVRRALGIEQCEPGSAITTRIAKLKEKLRIATKCTPFRIDVTMRDKRLVATISVKMLP